MAKVIHARARAHKTYTLFQNKLNMASTKEERMVQVIQRRWLMCAAEWLAKTLKSKELNWRVSHVNYVDSTISSQYFESMEKTSENCLLIFIDWFGESYHHINVFITNVLFMTNKQKKNRTQVESKCRIDFSCVCCYRRRHHHRGGVAAAVLFLFRWMGKVPRLRSNKLSFISKRQSCRCVWTAAVAATAPTAHHEYVKWKTNAKIEPSMSNTELYMGANGKIKSIRLVQHAPTLNDKSSMNEEERASRRLRRGELAFARQQHCDTLEKCIWIIHLNLYVWFDACPTKNIMIFCIPYGRSPRILSCEWWNKQTNQKWNWIQRRMPSTRQTKLAEREEKREGRTREKEGKKKTHRKSSESHRVEDIDKRGVAFIQKSLIISNEIYFSHARAFQQQTNT